MNIKYGNYGEHDWDFKLKRSVYVERIYALSIIKLMENVVHKNNDVRSIVITQDEIENIISSFCSIDREDERFKEGENFKENISIFYDSLKVLTEFNFLFSNYEIDEIKKQKRIYLHVLPSVVSSIPEYNDNYSHKLDNIADSLDRLSRRYYD